MFFLFTATFCEKHTPARSQIPICLEDFMSITIRDAARLKTQDED